jgi:AcrR family transcriptional regulator
MATSLDAASRPWRRDQQRDDTRRDLALAAFRLATSQGLADVRVPDIAAAAGVSARTFNNYFSSKEEAIVWPAAQHAASVADRLRERPPNEPLAEAIVAAVTSLYRPPAGRDLPAGWLRDFQALVASQPSLHGEYLKASSAAERALGDVLAERMGGKAGQLRPRVLAGMVVGAERAAVRYWMQTRQGSLAQAVRAAVRQATAGLGDTS